jgi:hypothetical protein
MIERLQPAKAPATPSSTDRVADLHPVPARLKDFIYFSQRQYDSLDYDPFHPMLWKMQSGMDKETALWHSTLFMAWYNIGSFHVVFNNCDVLKMPPDWTTKLPVGTQRRNLRGGRVLDHLEDFIRQAKRAGGIEKLLTYGMHDGWIDKGQLNRWKWLTWNVNGVWGNGRWSTYTTSELYQKVNKLDVLPATIMNEGSSGPRTGLAFMHGIETPQGTKIVPELDILAQRFFERVRPKIKTELPYLPKNHSDLGMVESQLCDFNSLRKGRYYIGRDIDRDQDRLRSTEKALREMGRKDQVKHLKEVWYTREKVFEKRYLGEFSGWPGRTDYAKQFYLKTGKVADHATIIKEMKDGYLF